jgi:hypothetical protein
MQRNPMPRKARMDMCSVASAKMYAPEALHHIVIRGIERKPIFKDSIDYHKFIERLGNILGRSIICCLAFDQLMLNNTIFAGRLNLTPSFVNKLVSRGRLEAETRKIAIDKLPK